ncbi:unnamed protein product [Urochloa humidicola]
MSDLLLEGSHICRPREKLHEASTCRHAPLLLRVSDQGRSPVSCKLGSKGLTSLSFSGLSSLANILRNRDGIFKR